MSWREGTKEVVETRPAVFYICDACGFEEEEQGCSPKAWAHYYVQRNTMIGSVVRLEKSEVSLHFCPKCEPSIRARLK